MIPALVILLAGLALPAVLIGARWLDMRAWQRSLRAYRLRLPSGLTVDDVARWLGSISALTHPPRWSLVPLPPVVLEVVASQRGISHFLVVSTKNEPGVLSSLRGVLPGVRLDEAPGFLAARPRCRMAAELTATNRARPLATDRAESISGALLAAMAPVPAGCEIQLQLVMTGAGTPKPVHTASPKREDRFWSTYLLDGSLPADAEAVKALRTKQQEPLLHGTLRLGVAAPHRAQARKLFARVYPNLHGANNTGVRLVRRWVTSRDVARRMHTRAYPLTIWPLLVNAAEAVSLTGFPLSGVQLPGLSTTTARQLPPAPSMPTYGTVLGLSNYPGLTDRPLALKREDRLKHTVILGPTGSGKSVLLARMILSDIAAGSGVVVIDPKDDLVASILDRIGDADADRVVAIDAGKRDMSIGFNPLGNASTEEDQERAVDDVLHIFKSIWREFWGPRSDSIMRCALATLASSRAPDGSVFTLAELAPLLTQPAFRKSLTQSARLPASLRQFWTQFDTWSPGQLVQAIGPVLNKVEAFTGRTPIRLILGQSSGLDLRSLFRAHRPPVILVSLAKGNVGTETANLLGSMLVSSLWQATLGRSGTPAEQRRPVYTYIDEAQDVVRLPLALADMLAQARGLGLGLTLAHQYISQIPEAVRAAEFGTVRTQIVFATELDDARLLAPRFSPLTVEDLTGLDAYEIAVRPSVDGKTLAPVTGRTLPLSEPTRDGAALAAQSRARHGVARADVEAALRARIEVDSRRAHRLGRERLEDES